MTTIYQSNVNNEVNPMKAVSKITTNESGKYKFLSSENIGKFFEDKGFTLDGASYANCRNPEKIGFQKHIMIFSRPDLSLDDGNKLQLLVTNAHDGSASLKLNLGVYRAICANGLVSGNDMYEQRIRHQGNNIQNQVSDSLYYILDHMTELKNEVATMKNTILSFDQSQQFLKDSADLRLKDIDVHSVRLDTIDKVRRNGDQGQDLYTVLNRVQESVIRGGIKYKKNTEIVDRFGNKIKTVKKGTTKKITAIDKSIELNKQLWSNAMELVV